MNTSDTIVADTANTADTTDRNETRGGVFTVAELSKANAMIARPLVFTNGCFDILHRGHVDYLIRARKLGVSLVVAVNDDDSVRRLEKGSGRPFNALEDRMAVLAALRCVDFVVSFAEDTPLAAIEALKPDHLVKGGDWSVDDIVGSDFVRQRGGEVHSLAFRFDRSTTALVDRIRKDGV